MLLLTVNLPLAEDTRDEVSRALRSLCGPVSVLPGCRSMHVYLSQDAPDDLLVVQEWQDRESLDAHLRSEDFRRLLLMMDLSRATPNLRMFEVHAVSGLEAVRIVRGEPSG